MSEASERPARRLRRRDALHRHTMRFGPNMTPMVDIVMVILIFFMAATSFAGDEWLLESVVQRRAGEQRAEAGDPMELPPVRIDISLAVDEQGRTVATGLGRRRVGLTEMVDRIGAFVEGTATERVIVLVRADSAVPYENVVRLHEACERLKIGRIGIGLD